MVPYTHGRAAMDDVRRCNAVECKQEFRHKDVVDFANKLENLKYAQGWWWAALGVVRLSSRMHI